jgi:hypothetical protein
MAFPVLRPGREGLALGYVVARTIEAVLILPAAVGPLILVAAADAPDPAQFAALHALTGSYEVWGYPVSTIFFCISVFLLNSVLFRARLVPRWIPGWALIAAVPYLADAFLGLFSVVSQSSPLHTAMVAPLALNELVLAGWLIVRGFRPEAEAQDRRDHEVTADISARS